MTRETTEMFLVEAGDTTVTLRKVYTPTGERIEVRHGDDRSRLDAVELETLTWQDGAFFEELVDGDYDYRRIDPRPRNPADLQVGNEYTLVRLRLVEDGAAVEVTSPKMGYGSRVDANAFAALVTKPKSFFSELLRTPYGPEDKEHIHVF